MNIIALVMLAIALNQPPAHATSVVKLDDDALVSYSGRIVEGIVTAKDVRWNDARTQIHTILEISVSEVHKGALDNPRTMTLRLLGGRVGDMVMELVGAPSFEVGEEVILFLDKKVTELYPFVGLSQGKLTIETDPETNTRMIKERGESHDAFVSRIKQIVDAQAEAKEDGR